MKMLRLRVAALHRVARVCRHIHHLRKVVRSSSSETEWVNAARDYPELLSCHTLGYNITAASDLIAVNCSAIRDGLPQSGIRLLMDIKQGIAASDVNQAQARLLLGNLHSPESRPALVRSDLTLAWQLVLSTAKLSMNSRCMRGSPCSSNPRPEHRVPWTAPIVTVLLYFLVVRTSLFGTACQEHACRGPDVARFRGSACSPSDACPFFACRC